MKNFVRTTLLAATLAGVSFGAFATAVPNPPPARPGSYCPASEADKRSDYPDQKTSPTTGNRRQSDFYEGN